jgi:hypothetical protein
MSFRIRRLENVLSTVPRTVCYSRTAYLPSLRASKLGVLSYTDFYSRRGRHDIPVNHHFLPAVELSKRTHGKAICRQRQSAIHDISCQVRRQRQGVVKLDGTAREPEKCLIDPINVYNPVLWPLLDEITRFVSEKDPPQSKVSI